MAAGASSSQLRSATVVETVPGTTPATPAFKTLHAPILFDDETARASQSSLIAGGGNIGDTMLYRAAAGKIADADVVYGVYDTFLESLLQSTWTTNVITDAKLMSSFTVENAIPAGIGGTNTMKRYRGVEATGAKFSVDARGKVKFSMDFLGIQTLDTAAVAIAGATYTNPTNVDPFSATTDIGVVTIAGYTLDDMVSMEMDLSYEGKVGQAKLGGDVLVGIARGVFRPKITMKFYIQANHALLYDAARLQTQTNQKITINMGSVTLKKYKFEFLNCNIMTAVPDFTGPSAFLTVTAEPRYDVTAGGFLTITRAIA